MNTTMTLGGHFTYFVTIFLMVAGLFIVIARGNLIKKLIGLGIFQTSVYLLYIAPGKLHYSAPVTNVPVAFVGRELTIEGDFLDAASITGVKVTVTKTSRFAKDLEVIAAEFGSLLVRAI